MKIIDIVKKYGWANEPQAVHEVSAAKALSVISACGEVRVAMKDSAQYHLLWPTMPLLYEVLPTVRTKEGPMDYPIQETIDDDTRWRIVLRIIKGRLYNKKQQLDAYAWDKETFLDKIPRPAKIGCNSQEGRQELQKVLDMMPEEKERQELLAFLRCFTIDFVGGFSAPEERYVAVVTKDMIDAGLTGVVNEWTTEPPYTITPVNVGDVLVITNKGMYVIQHDEFVQTHSTFVF